jgi:hypothetical protein
MFSAIICKRKCFAISPDRCSPKKYNTSFGYLEYFILSPDLANNWIYLQLSIAMKRELGSLTNTSWQYF